MDAFDTAKQIFSLLRVEKNDPGIMSGLKAACADCDRMGPKNGGSCMSLRLAQSVGCDYTPPEWCKDPSYNGGIKDG